MLLSDVPPHETQQERTVRMRAQDERRPVDGRQRKIACRARITMPGRTPDEGDTIFTCNRDAHVGSQHSEEGRVRNKEGKVSTYIFSWQDSNVLREVWRTSDNTHTG